MAKNVITVSRKYGSRGRDMGVALSKLLGIEYYDKDLIKIASEETGVHESLFGQADEKIRGSFFIKKSGAYKGIVEPPTSGDYTSDKNIFNLQAEVIKRLAERNPVSSSAAAPAIFLRTSTMSATFFFTARTISASKTLPSAMPLKRRTLKSFASRSQESALNIINITPARNGTTPTTMTSAST